MTETATWMRERAQQHMSESVATQQAVATECGDAILAAAHLIADTFRHGGHLLLCGNGGSAADCQHMAAEFTSRLTKDFARAALPAIALTTDTSFLTAFANDCGFEDVFARQVAALGRPGDTLLGISTSGSSTNVMRAVDEALARQMRVIALMGHSGPLADRATVALRVPSQQTQYIQESHIMIEHILCDLAERLLFGRDGTAPMTREG